MEGGTQGRVNTIDIQGGVSAGNEEGEGNEGGGNACHVEREAAVSVCLSQQMWAALDEDLNRRW